MQYDAGKEFREHRHKLNPRTIELTQECFIVFAGRIRVVITPELALPPQTLEAGRGEAVFVWGGFHRLEIVEDGTLVYEIKAGSFTTVEADKEFLP